MKLTWQQKFAIFWARALSWVIPSLSARLSLKLFLTPTRIPRPPSEDKFYETAKKYRLPTGNAAFEWGPEHGPLVILIHGWNGRGTQMGAFAAPLVEKGFRVVALDGPGHGESSGNRTNVGDFANFLVKAQQFLGPTEAMIAHSMGAGCTVVALQRGLRLERMALIAGPSRYEVVVGNFLRRMQLSPWAEKSFIKSLTKKVGLSPAQLNIGLMIQNLKVPTLVVHDTDDKEVRFQAAIEIKQAWPEAKLLETSGLGHRKVLRDPQVIEEVVNFITTKE